MRGIVFRSGKRIFFLLKALAFFARKEQKILLFFLGVPYEDKKDFPASAFSSEKKMS